MIAVTGASGFVGKAVCECFEKMNEPFLPIIHKSLESVRDGTMITDLSMPDCLKALDGVGINSLVHLAARIPIYPFYLDERYMKVNRLIDNNVLNFCMDNDIHVIYMSTCGIYNNMTKSVKHEDNESSMNITTPYYAGKYESEKLFWNKTYATIMRLSSPIGVLQKNDTVVSKFIDAVTRTNLPIQIWGSGNREQDFIDVRDVARLIYKSIKYDIECVVNVASGVSTTMLNLANTIINVAGHGKIEFAKVEDPNENQTARYSIERAFSLFDWEPVYSLQDSIRWIINNEN
jgi:nucleoside-diphosphate-sugar epimerase